MAAINWEFLVDFPQPARFVEYLLPKPDRVFIRVDFLAVSGTPATAAPDVTAVNPATTFRFLPVPKLPLIRFS
jgi:hypothetical protein